MLEILCTVIDTERNILTMCAVINLVYSDIILPESLKLTVFLLCSFFISENTVQTLTYDDWENNMGSGVHTVQAFVTPTMMVSLCVCTVLS